MLLLGAGNAPARCSAHDEPIGVALESLQERAQLEERLGDRRVWGPGGRWLAKQKVEPRALEMSYKISAPHLNEQLPSFGVIYKVKWRHSLKFHVNNSIFIKPHPSKFE